MVIFDSLNEAQKKAVLLNDEPIMILAGAGSGKTRTLVAKVVYLLKHAGYRPDEILALTFSNKAAKEMRERVELETKEDFGSLQVTTFHSFCARLLRYEGEYLGLSRNFTIYDESESRTIVKNILTSKGIGLKEISPYDVLYFIDKIKNSGYYLGRFADNAEYQNHEYWPFFLEYESELSRSNAVDFGSLITGVLKLFENYPQVLLSYQKKYQYILIDEYQDTNRAQFDLMTHLARRHQRICCVGDEDQSIYSWRGANIHNILDFETSFKKTQIVKLEENYRSTKNIISAASSVINKNEMRSDKYLWTQNDQGEHIDINECSSEKGEGRFIAKKILQLANAQIFYKNMAIFYRNNFQSRVIEDHLRMSNIPYKVIGGVKFYDRKEIKDVLSYLRVIVNKKDSISLFRSINTPGRGIGAVTLRKIETEALKNNISLWEVLERIESVTHDCSHLKMSKKIQGSISQYLQLINSVKDDHHSGLSPSDCLANILKGSGILEYLKKSKDYESMARVENLEELNNAILQYEELVEGPSLEGFLETIALDTATRKETGEEVRERGEVSLMTIHGAKGLEFSYVFLLGAEENIFPSYKSLQSDEMALEEERRLFYVAMTRAMKKLYITYATARMFYGSVRCNHPSRFLYEIPGDHCIWKTQEKEPRTIENATSGNNEHDSFSKRSKIVHKVYGEGIVLEINGRGDDRKVLVEFKNGLKKRFMLKFAPISYVSKGFIK